MNINLDNIETIFFDFDGVIKASLKVKGDAFCDLFKQYGQETSNRINLHHNQNTGVSRFVKIPLYLSWVGVKPSQDVVDEYCARFSKLVVQKVIDCEWVSNVVWFFESNYKKKKCTS